MDWHHVAVGLATLSPLPAGSGTPLGRYGPVVAALTALSVLFAALGAHLAGAISAALGSPGRVSSDPFLDSAALLVIGVVLGASALGGQAQAAHDSAIAANLRLDRLGAPPAGDGNVAKDGA